MDGRLNLFFPQWQGSGRRSVYDGAMALKAWIGDGMDLTDIPVGTDEAAGLVRNIRSYEVLLSQLEAAGRLIAARSPRSILTVGGDCSSVLAPIAYLNRLYRGDLGVVWLDAHGDLNSPESSPSKLFTGMPLRFLLGDGEPEVLARLDSRLEPGQLVLAGTRDLDPPEEEIISTRAISVVGPDALAASPQAAASRLKARGFDNVYIHVDTDVLDHEAFRFSAWHAPGGISPETLAAAIGGLVRNFRVVGCSLVEFTPGDDAGMRQLAGILQAASPRGPRGERPG